MNKLSAVRSPRDDEAAPLRSVSASAPESEGELDLTELLGTLVERRWLIAATTALLATLGSAYALLATPVYLADALVQVEQKSGGMGGLDELSSMFNGETPAEAEIELIRSRMVVGSVVDQLHLDVEVEPLYFPLFGRALARRHEWIDTPAGPVLGLARFAWGGERIKVQRLDTPLSLENEPLTLVAGEGGQYSLYGPDDELLLNGEVGSLASIRTAPLSARAAQSLDIFVAELAARPGTRFQLMKRPRAEAIKQLQEDLRLGERGKKTGLIRLALEGVDRERIAATLDALTQVYLRQNVERRSSEAEKTLEFVTGQLPALKQNLDEAEKALNEYRTKSGSVDVGLEAQAIIQRAADAEKSLTELELQYAELRQRFTENHPTLVALRRKMDQLRGDRASIEGRFRSLPESELMSVRLTRDVKVANELYLLLLNKAQELRVVKSGTVGNVRIVDPASIDTKPVRPKRPLVVLGSLAVGAGLGLVLALVLRILRRGVNDPSLFEQEFGLSVYASVPHSPKQAEMLRAASCGDKDALAPLALTGPTDLAMESIRSLRTSLQFAQAESGSNVVAIGGPRPGVGKSFVAVNLAHVLADTGKRVLLVDADMRKGLLHRYFGQERGPGLSELIRGSIGLAEGTRPTQASNLSFIATGAVPPNPSELLASTRFRQIVAEMSAHFDLVLLDAPPVLAVTDATLLAQVAGVNLLVLKAGLHPMREVAVALARLEQNGVRPNGFVVNGMPAQPSGFTAARYGYHYQYEYK